MNRMNIYVGNISTTVSEDQLRDLFSQFGQVTSVKLIKDKFTGDVRGFAFVEMASNEEGLNAIAKSNGMELNGQRLRVNEARPREENNDRPRRSFGDRNDRGGNGGGFGGSRY